MRFIKHYWPFMAGSLVLLALLLLTTLLTSAHYEQSREHQLQRLNQTPGLGATWFTYEEGLFHQRGELHLNLVDPAQLLRALGLATQAGLGQRLAQMGPLELYLQVDTLLLPGYSRSEARLLTDRGSLALLQESGQLQAGSLLLQWQTPFWQDEQRLQLSADSWQWQGASEQLYLNPWTLALTRTGLGDWQAAWQLAGLQLSHGDRSLALRGLTGQLQLMPADDVWLIPQLQAQLQEASVQQGEKPQLLLTGAALRGAVHESKNGLLTLVDMQWRGTIDQLTQHQPSQRHELQDLAMGLSLGGIDRQGYSALFWSAITDFSDSKAWHAALNRVTRSGFHLRLSPSQLRMQQGLLRAEGEITSRPFDMAQLAGLASLRSLLQGNLTLHADPQLARQLSPSAEQLSELQQAGYIAPTEHGELHSQLRMVNGKLSANGYKLPW